MTNRVNFHVTTYEWTTYNVEAFKARIIQRLGEKINNTVILVLVTNVSTPTYQFSSLLIPKFDLDGMNLHTKYRNNLKTRYWNNALSDGDVQGITFNGLDDFEFVGLNHWMNPLTVNGPEQLDIQNIPVGAGWPLNSDLWQVYNYYDFRSVDAAKNAPNLAWAISKVNADYSNLVMSSRSVTSSCFLYYLGLGASNIPIQTLQDYNLTSTTSATQRTISTNLLADGNGQVVFLNGAVATLDLPTANKVRINKATSDGQPDYSVLTTTIGSKFSVIKKLVRGDLDNAFYTFYINSNSVNGGDYLDFDILPGFLTPGSVYTNNMKIILDKPIASTVAELSDVNAAPTNNQVLTWQTDASVMGGKWVAANNTGGGVTRYEDLTDVDVTGRLDGSITNWNATSTNYEPVNEIKVDATSRDIAILTTGLFDSVSAGNTNVGSTSGSAVFAGNTGVTVISGTGTAKLESSTALAEIVGGVNAQINAVTGIITLVAESTTGNIHLSVGDDPDACATLNDTTTIADYATKLLARDIGDEVMTLQATKNYVTSVAPSAPTYANLTDVATAGRADGSATHYVAADNTYKPINEITVLPTNRNVQIITSGTGEIRSGGALTIQTTASAPVTITANGTTTGNLNLDAENIIIGTAINDIAFTSSAGDSKLVSTVASTVISAGTNINLDPKGSTSSSLVRITGQRTPAQYATQITGADEAVPNVKYVNDLVTTSANLKVNKSGDTMTGTLDMGAQKITSTYVPVASVDLVNKAFVDSRTLNDLADVTTVQPTVTPDYNALDTTPNLLIRYRADEAIQATTYVSTWTPTFNSLGGTTGILNNDTTTNLFTKTFGVNGWPCIQTPVGTASGQTNTATLTALSVGMNLVSAASKTYFLVFSDAVDGAFDSGIFRFANGTITPTFQNGILMAHSGNIKVAGSLTGAIPTSTTTNNICIGVFTLGVTGLVVGKMINVPNGTIGSYVNFGNSVGLSSIDRLYIENTTQQLRVYELMAFNTELSVASSEAIVAALWQRYANTGQATQSFALIKANATGTLWSNDYANLRELADCSILTPANGQLLRYNGTKWVNYVQTQVYGVPLSSSGAGAYIASAPVWKDLLGEVSLRAGGAGAAPVVSQYDVAGNYWEYATATGAGNLTQIYFTYHIPHDYILGTDLFIHLHNSIITTSTTTTVWGVQAAFAASGGVFPALIDIGNISRTYTGLARTHHVDEIPLSIAGGSATRLNSSIIDTDGLVLVRLFRTQGLNGDNMTNNDQVFIHSVDIHYQAITDGTLNRVAPFRT